MLHIYPMCGIFYLPSIDTGTRGCQFNVSSEWHPTGILLMKVLGKFWVLRPGIEPRTSSTAGKRLNHLTTQLTIYLSTQRAYSVLLLDLSYKNTRAVIASIFFWPNCIYIFIFVGFDIAECHHMNLSVILIKCEHTFYRLIFPSVFFPLYFV